MKRLINHTFDASLARSQWHEYVTLMQSNPVLKEARDVLPFFKTRPDISLLIANYFPAIRNPNVLAHEFTIYGDFCADLIVGDFFTSIFLLIEFEDGSHDSIFK